MMMCPCILRHVNILTNENLIFYIHTAQAKDELIEAVTRKQNYYIMFLFLAAYIYQLKT